MAWKIKEDIIYDIDRNVSETRIIGMAPVGMNKTTKDTTELYWIYFPGCTVTTVIILLIFIFRS